jgi:hypothetical protein
MSQVELKRLQKQIAKLESENRHLRHMNKRLRIVLMKANKGEGAKYLEKLEAIMKMNADYYALPK